jgi:hypothetical protein
MVPDVDLPEGGGHGRDDRRIAVPEAEHPAVAVAVPQPAPRPPVLELPARPLAQDHLVPGVSGVVEPMSVQVLAVRASQLAERKLARQDSGEWWAILGSNQ